MKGLENAKGPLRFLARNRTGLAHLALGQEAGKMLTAGKDRRYRFARGGTRSSLNAGGVWSIYRRSAPRPVKRTACDACRTGMTARKRRQVPRPACWRITSRLRPGPHHKPQRHFPDRTGRKKLRLSSDAKGRTGDGENTEDDKPGPAPGFLLPAIRPKKNPPKRVCVERVGLRTGYRHPCPTDSAQDAAQDVVQQPVRSLGAAGLPALPGAADRRPGRRHSRAAPVRRRQRGPSS